jgi:hypothetical protein
MLPLTYMLSKFKHYTRGRKENNILPSTWNNLDGILRGDVCIVDNLIMQTHNFNVCP